MKITAYPLYDDAPPLRIAAEELARVTAYSTFADNQNLAQANRQGWVLLCPCAFAATWNGGPNPEDIELEMGEATTPGTDFVQSVLGTGLLTFYPGYQFKTEDAYALWVRGPVNAPKDGLAPLESLVDAALLPATLAIHWQFTRPHQTIRFEAGEPFATILPYAKNIQDDVTLEVVPLDADVDAYEQAFQQLIDSAAVQNVFQRMGAVAAETIAPEQTQDSERNTASQWAKRVVDPPAVSCICPTYGRVALLEEAIESFLRQDYPGPKELIILNDYAEQTLVFNHPDVRVINLPQRLHSVGEKYKMAVGLAAHDLLFVWHDDDIYLPHRLSYSVAKLDPKKAFFKANKAWFWNEGQLSGPDENTFHGGSCWRRTLFSQVQGYPHINQGYDVEFEQRCKAAAPTTIQVQPVQPVDIYYLYRWQGTGSYHFSVLGTNGQEDKQVTDYVAQQAAHAAIPQGQIQLQPQWKCDYGALVQDYLTTLPAEDQGVGCTVLDGSSVYERWDQLLDYPSLVWHDGYWTMGRSATLELAAWLEDHRPHRILELGSGNTTAFLAQYARRHSAEVITLEHDPSHYQRTCQLLQQLNLLEAIQVRHAPLTQQTFQNGKEYYWYDTSLAGVFDFLLVDGPPGHYGRQAALFAVEGHLAARWHLWLDDGQRSHEQQCVELWAQSMQFTREFHLPSHQGMWLLGSHSSQAVSNLSMTVERLGVSLVTGSRLEQFELLLRSLKLQMPGLLEHSYTLVTVSGSDPELQAYVDQLPFVDHCFRYSMSPGDVTSRALLTLAGIPRVERILQLAEGWQAATVQRDWLERADHILAADPAVGQVRLRHRSEKTASYHPITQRPIVWKPQSGALISRDAHYTFEPSLIRAQDAATIFPCVNERDAQQRFLQTGFAVAQLLPGVYRRQPLG